MIRYNIKINTDNNLNNKYLDFFIIIFGQRKK
jgi:hypothetical protein